MFYAASNKLKYLPQSILQIANARILLSKNPFVYLENQHIDYMDYYIELEGSEDENRKILQLYISPDPRALAIKKVRHSRTKHKNITHKWQHECSRKNPNLPALKNMFKRMLEGFAIFHGETIDPAKIDSYLETVSVRQLCKDFAVKLSQPIKTCHNDTTLLGDEWSKVDPLDVIVYKEGNISYCFTPEELLEIKEKNKRRNPYTRNKIPQNLFTYAQQYLEQMKLPRVNDGTEIKEEMEDPVITVGLQIDTLLSTSHNGSVFSEMVRGANIPQLAELTYALKNRITEAGGQIDMFYSEYRLVVQNPSPEGYARWLLHIMNGNNTDTVRVFLFYLNQV
jgi:hypothetical protein